jgi:hypothetical protein
MPCARGCCVTQREHYRSIAVRPTIPGPKVTVDHTDQTINTITEHWSDRQDTNVQIKPVHLTLPMELKPKEVHA